MVPSKDCSAIFCKPGSTVVRATDRALTHLDIASSRITIGAGVTFARVLAERELAFLHPVAGSIGGAGRLFGFEVLSATASATDAAAVVSSNLAMLVVETNSCRGGVKYRA